MNTLSERKTRASQRMMIGFHGKEVTAELREVARISPMGFVLFERNVASAEQVFALNEQLGELTPSHLPPIRAVDQEGGRVQRIRSTKWPSLAVLGEQPHRVPGVARAIGEELAAMGFQLNFAPVADVHSNPENAVIGDRSFHQDPDEVAKLVAEFVHHHQEAGVLCCMKHFPGHGDTTEDSHKALPTVQRTLTDWNNLERTPFSAGIEADVASAMTAHVVNTAFDSAPATLSSKVIPKLLREKLNFQGVVFSDDLEMKAVSDSFSLTEMAYAATHASVDVLLVCHSPGRQMELYEALVRLQERDPYFEHLCDQAVVRVHTLRKRAYRKFERPPLWVVGSEAHRQLASGAIR